MEVEGGLIKIFAPLLSPIKRNQTPWAWPPLLFLPKNKSLEKGNWEAGDRVAHVPGEGGQAQSQRMRKSWLPWDISSLGPCLQGPRNPPQHLQAQKYGHGHLTHQLYFSQGKRGSVLGFVSYWSVTCVQSSCESVHSHRQVLLFSNCSLHPLGTYWPLEKCRSYLTF